MELHVDFERFSTLENKSIVVLALALHTMVGCSDTDISPNYRGHLEEVTFS